MEQKMGYEKYKESFRKICVHSCMACGFMLAAIIISLFIPCFGYKEKVFGKKELVDSFSIVDEAKWLSKCEKLETPWSLGFLLIVGIVILLMVSYTLQLIKYKKYLSKLDEYACEEYGNIKANTPSKKRWLCSVEEIGVMLLVYVLSIVAYITVMDNHANGTIGNYGYFVFVNTVTSECVFALLPALLALFISLKVKKLYNDLKMEILLETKDKNEKESEEKA